MKKRWILLFVCLGLVMGGTIVSCKCCSDDDPKAIKERYLPRRAEEVKILGNGWIQFTLDSEQYLFNKYSNQILLIPQPKG